MTTRGWVLPALAVVAGALAAYGMPPDGIAPLTLLGFAAVAWFLPDVSPRRAALLMWLFQTALHFATTSWISEAFLVVMPAMGHFALAPVLALSAGMALFAACTTYLWRRFWPNAARPSAASFLALAMALSLAEWLMGHVATGFPWTVVALAFAETGLAPNLNTLGAYGLGLTLLAAALSVVGATRAMLQARRPVWREITLSAFAMSVLAAPWSIDVEPPSAARPAPEADRPIIRLVQGNTPQRQKWRVERRAQILAEQLRLSSAPAERPLTAVVWSETATPFLVLQSESALAAIGAAAPDGGYVILGTPAETRTPDGGRRSTNSLIAVDGAGRAVVQYDKAHLVPFGEYVPFRDYLPIDQLVEGRGSFSPGPGIATLKLPGLPAFSPLICYEVIFPGAVARDDDRPAFLLNITNDAWYGVSAGPYQHLAITRMRAVEEGLPVIRVANTGISAAFDGHGRELGRIPLERTGFIDVELPPPLPPTRYAEYGDAFYFGALIVMLLAAYRFRPRPTP